MTEKLKSDILSVKTVKRVMPACIVYALVQAMTFMVDTVISGICGYSKENAFY